MIEEAQAHFESGNLAAAEVLYRKMLEEEPDNPEVLYMLALARQGQNDLDEPLSLLAHALTVQPGNPSLHYSLGTIYLRREQLAEAEQSFYKATGIDPNFAAAQNGIAIVELTRGRFPAAEHALRKALKAEPENPQALINMGIALLEQQREADAISYLQKVVQADPDNAMAQLQLGRAFLASGSSGFATKCFENALLQKPNAVDVLRLLALSQFRSQQFIDAAKTYRNLLQLGQESTEVLAGLAHCLVATGADREAEGLFIRALRLSNNEEGLLLDFADLLMRQGNYADVINRLTGHVGEARDVSRMSALLADARLKFGDAAGAENILQSLVDKGEQSPALRLLLARALADAGKNTEANTLLDSLLGEESCPVEAVLLRARQFGVAGESAPAVELLRGVQRRHDLHHQQRQQAVAMLADTLHQQGSHQAAWELYLGLDRKAAEVLTIRKEQPLKLEKNEAAETAMEREIAWAWPPQPLEDGRPEPVFLFAWPGAGREALLRSLKAHRGICVVDDALEDQARRRIEVSHPQGKNPLNEMTTAQIQLARRKYWKLLRMSNGRAGSTALTIDAMWLTAEALPTLYRLFPQAHVIVLEQDARDQAVAWFQAGFTDLEGMAKEYSRQTDLLNRCRAGVPLNYIDVDASRLAGDAGAVLREIVSELSIAWEPAVEQKWLARGPTVEDLASAGSWNAYQAWLEPVFETLSS